MQITQAYALNGIHWFHWFWGGFLICCGILDLFSLTLAILKLESLVSWVFLSIKTCKMWLFIIRGSRYLLLKKSFQHVIQLIPGCIMLSLIIYINNKENKWVGGLPKHFYCVSYYPIYFASMINTLLKVKQFFIPLFHRGILWVRVYKRNMMWWHTKSFY